VRTAQQVAGAQSGTGFQEALEQLARMAQQQQGMNGDAQGLLPMMAPGGDAVMQRLRELAGRQRALAEQLERMQASGDASAAARWHRKRVSSRASSRRDGSTAAPSSARSSLYRKLLDAGRSLSGDEPDQQKERTSRSAIGDSVHTPLPYCPAPPARAPRSATRRGRSSADSRPSSVAWCSSTSAG